MESVKEIVSGQDAIDIIECIILMNPETFDEVFDTLNLCDTGNTKQNFLAMSRRLCGQYLIEDFKLDPRWASMTEIELKEARDRLRNKVIIDLAKTNHKLSMRLLGSQFKVQNNLVVEAVNNKDASSETFKSRLENFQVRYPMSETFPPETRLCHKTKRFRKIVQFPKFQETKADFYKILPVSK